MEYLTQKEIEKTNSQTFKHVFITMILLFGFIIISALILVQQGYSFHEALQEGFHLVAHFPKAPIQNVAISLLSILGGILVLFIIVTLISIIYEGGLRYEVKEGQKMKKISKIKNHVIICGANIVGNNVSIKLDAMNIPFIIVDDDVKGLSEPRSKDYIVVEGNPLDEDTLSAAAIKKAAMLVAVQENDGANFLLASLAKKLNPEIRVIAKTDHPQFVEHMEKIGADLVMMPEILGAFKIADVVSEVLKIEK